MRWDPQWETFYRQNEGNQYPNPHIVRFVARNYYRTKPRSSVNILDIGCGAGANLWYLAREGFSGYGIDGSITSIRRSEEKLKKDNLTADIIVGDFFSLPYDDYFFNAVIDAASIQHNNPESITKIVSEIYRVLNNNGKYFGLLIESDEELSDNKFSTHYFNKNEIRSLFSKFNKISIDNIRYTEKNEEKMISFLIVEATKC